MDVCSLSFDTMMYGEPGDIWIFKVSTLNRVANPDHVHNEASALAELHLGYFINLLPFRIILRS